MEQQYLIYEGEQYLITATKIQFKFEKLVGDQVIQESKVKSCEEDQSWSYIHDGESQILTTFRRVDEDKNLQYLKLTVPKS